MKDNNFLFIILLFAGWGVLYYFLVDNRTTTIEPRTITIVEPGRIDTVPKPVPVIQLEQSRDSIEYWKGKYDSIQAVIANGDTEVSRDSIFSEYFLPYKATVRDSLTSNYLTIFPLNPLGSRLRIDSTRYDTLKISFTYADTTIYAPRRATLRTYIMVGGGAVIGASLGGEPGALVGALLGIVADELF
jgi:hypothetical protein